MPPLIENATVRIKTLISTILICVSVLVAGATISWNISAGWTTVNHEIKDLTDAVRRIDKKIDDHINAHRVTSL